ncbi:MAG: hypothetical protein U1E60_00960 [Reyranellaceae bacterium]
MPEGLTERAETIPCRSCSTRCACALEEVDAYFSLSFSRPATSSLWREGRVVDSIATAKSDPERIMAHPLNDRPSEAAETSSPASLKRFSRRGRQAAAVHEANLAVICRRSSAIAFAATGGRHNSGGKVRQSH